MEYAKFESIEPTKEIINLEELTKKTFNELINIYKNKNNTNLKFSNKLPLVLGDKFLMKEVIENLISNSLKFTSNNKEAIIEVGYKYINNENVFYIKDNGVGFNMEFSEGLFSMFKRMHSETEFEGSGMGLYIVKNIIKKFGGHAWITGKVNSGAEIYFTIGEENILK